MLVIRSFSRARGSYSGSKLRISPVEEVVPEDKKPTRLGRLGVKRQMPAMSPRLKLKHKPPGAP